ncbi:MAG: zeta toxin family protein, partial [Desulfobacterales bacterium]|nr:zeta toxin family protein [Desulfobacterales bacterium]
MNHRPFVIGIAGGTGSGKTYLCDKLSHQLGEENTVCIEVDAYYRDLSGTPISERTAVNFDHPDSLETDLLLSHLKALARGKTVPKPVYDFTTHTRTDRTITISPKPFILAEGILLQALDGIDDHLDFTIYLDVPADIR